MPAAVHTATLGSLSLKQIESSNVSWNGQPVELNASGAVDVSEYLGGPGDYRASFESTDLGGIAAVSGFATSGIAISGGTILIPYQVRANLSTFASGANHYAISGTNGLATLDSINLPASGNATASIGVVLLSSDGVTAPVTVSATESLTAETPNAMYTLGPVAVNGTVLTQVTGVTVSMGVEVSSPIYQGNYAQEAFIVRRRPVIDVTTYNLGQLAALGGTWGVGTSVVVYARQRSGVGFSADASAVHVSISFADGLVQPVQTIAGAGVGGHSTRTLRFFGEAAVVSGSSAIT